MIDLDDEIAKRQEEIKRYKETYYASKTEERDSILRLITSATNPLNIYFGTENVYVIN